ncbi:hypothetical protein I4U23_004564 [Adineta vaga]|nr:hypothetical protein I4U23_004564 [Adineta vaga]
MATAIYSNSSQEKYDFVSDPSRTTNDRNQLLQCSFCEQAHTSTEALGKHLMQCGNKTDECPKCRKYIRRAIFVYHYENNCSNVDETDTSSLQSINSLKHLKDNCPDNTGNTIRKVRRSRVCSAASERRTSENIVHIPCEICNQLVDLSIWSKHIQDCREQENHQIQTRAQSKAINQELNQDKLPCEYCKRLFLAKLLESHQTSCWKKPEKLPRSSKSYSSLPVSSKTGRHRMSSQGTEYRRPLECTKTQENNVSSFLADRMSNGHTAQLINSSKNISNNESLLEHKSNQRLSRAQLSPCRPRTASLIDVVDQLHLVFLLHIQILR